MFLRHELERSQDWWASRRWPRCWSANGTRTLWHECDVVAMDGMNVMWSPWMTIGWDYQCVQLILKSEFHSLDGAASFFFLSSLLRGRELPKLLHFLLPLVVLRSPRPMVAEVLRGEIAAGAARPGAGASVNAEEHATRRARTSARHISPV